MKFVPAILLSVALCPVVAAQSSRDQVVRVPAESTRDLTVQVPASAALDTVREIAAARVAEQQARGHIGVTLGRIDDALAAQLGLDPDEVILITGVRSGGPADRAGVQRHDIITHIDGEAPAGPERLRRAVRSKEPGEELSLRVLREGEPAEITIEIAAPREPLREVPLTRDGLRALGEILDEETIRELRLRFDGPQIARELRRHLRIDLDAMGELRSAVERELEKFREQVLDEENWQKLHQSLNDAIEQALEVIERTRVELELLPRIEIMREREAAPGRRNMMFYPQPGPAPMPPRRSSRGPDAAPSPGPAPAPAAPQPMPPSRSPRGPDAAPGPGPAPAPAAPQPPRARADELEQRLERLEDRLERIERMLRRFEQRQGGE
jgi:hypothetical protein